MPRDAVLQRETTNMGDVLVLQSPYTTPMKQPIRRISSFGGPDEEDLPDEMKSTPQQSLDNTPTKGIHKERTVQLNITDKPSKRLRLLDESDFVLLSDFQGSLTKTQNEYYLKNRITDESIRGSLEFFEKVRKSEINIQSIPATIKSYGGKPLEFFEKFPEERKSHKRKPKLEERVVLDTSVDGQDIQMVIQYEDSIAGITQRYMDNIEMFRKELENEKKLIEKKYNETATTTERKALEQLQKDIEHLLTVSQLIAN